MRRLRTILYTAMATLVTTSFVMGVHARTYAIPSIDAQLAQEEGYVTTAERRDVRTSISDALKELEKEDPNTEYITQRVDSAHSIVSGHQAPAYRLRMVKEGLEAGPHYDHARANLRKASRSLETTIRAPTTQRSQALLEQRAGYVIRPIVPYAAACLILFAMPLTNRREDQ